MAEKQYGIGKNNRTKSITFAELETRMRKENTAGNILSNNG